VFCGILPNEKLDKILTFISGVGRWPSCASPRLSPLIVSVLYHKRMEIASAKDDFFSFLPDFFYSNAAIDTSGTLFFGYRIRHRFVEWSSGMIARPGSLARRIAANHIFFHVFSLGGLV
jgi:hypothetical protein